MHRRRALKRAPLPHGLSRHPFAGINRIPFPRNEIHEGGSSNNDLCSLCSSKNDRVGDFRSLGPIELEELAMRRSNTHSEPALAAAAGAV